ncbi:MAG: TonB-dependent receptor plug domain-containing protein [Flavobacteriales bacterium]|jgi:outer membrane receptor for ferrienterochelin and colicins|nr:TonB-dependent receptor plug domain-containing protein [Flavobacteriales bacterium]
MKVKFLFFFLLISQLFWAQNTEFFILTTAQEPVENAHIKHRKRYYVSNEKGAITIPNIQENDTLKVSHILFSTQIWVVKQKVPSQKILLKPKEEKLGEIILSAQMTGRKAEEVIKNIGKIPTKQIAQYGAQDAGQALKWQSGLSIQRDAVLGASLSINGLSGEHVKILIDGVELNGRSDGFIDLDQLLMQGEQEIELIKGPSSIEYGSNALGGVVNIITKDLHKRDTLGLKIDQLIDNTGTYQSSLHGFRTKGKHSYNLYLQRFLFDGWSDSDPFFSGFSKEIADSSRFRVWAPKETYQAKLKYDYQGDKIHWQIQGQYNNEFILKRGYPFAPPSYSKARDSKISSDRWLGQIILDGDYNEQHSFKVQTNYQSYNRVRKGVLTDLNTLQEKPILGLTDTTNFGSFLVRYQGAWKKLEYGGDLQYERILGNRILNKEQIQTAIGLFSKYRWNLNDKNQFLFGLRANIFAGKWTPLIPSLAWRHNFSKKHLLKASIAKGYRIASLKERFFEFIDNNHHIIGNKNIEPENSSHLLASMHHNLQNWKISYGTFYNHILSPIRLAPTENDGEFTYFNLHEYRGTGFNFEVNWRNKKWSLGLKNNWVFDQFIEPGRTKNNWNRNIQIGGNIRYQANEKWAFFSNIMHYGTQKIWRVEKDSEVLVNQEPYSWWDSGVEFNSQKRWKAFFWLQNILDVKNLANSTGSAHSSSNQFIARGRLVQVKIQFRL